MHEVVTDEQRSGFPTIGISPDNTLISTVRSILSLSFTSNRVYLHLLAHHSAFFILKTETFRLSLNKMQAN